MNEIISSLKQRLKPSRFENSMGVAETARSLALIYGEDTDKAYLAGILHDCAKCFSEEELRRKILQYGIQLDEISAKSPQLWHSFVGAYEAREIYGIDDQDIFDAIYYHTIGKAAMSKLCSIIYLADAIEPARDYPGAEALRITAQKSLDTAVLEYTEQSIKFVLDKGALLHPNAVSLRNYYIMHR